MERITLEDFKKEFMKDPEAVAAYEKRRPAFELRSLLLKMRFAAGLTQSEMAERMGVTKRTVMKLESADETYSPRHSMLEKYATAAGFKLELQFEAIAKAD